MAITDDLTRLENAKTAISTAINGKGVTVPSGTKIDGMAALINNISGYQVVSGSSAGDITLTNLSFTPKFAMVYYHRTDNTSRFCFKEWAQGSGAYLGSYDGYYLMQGASISRGSWVPDSVSANSITISASAGTAYYVIGGY